MSALVAHTQFQEEKLRVNRQPRGERGWARFLAVFLEEAGAAQPCASPRAQLLDRHSLSLSPPPLQIWVPKPEAEGGGKIERKTAFVGWGRRARKPVSAFAYSELNSLRVCKYMQTAIQRESEIAENIKITLLEYCFMQTMYVRSVSFI